MKREVKLWASTQLVVSNTKEHSSPWRIANENVYKRKKYSGWLGGPEGEGIVVEPERKNHGV